MTLRIAMWSGPRNVSTALMRSFENRPDTVVCDEPFYAHYLRHTGREHPMAQVVMEQHECDWEVVAKALTSTPSPFLETESGQAPAVFYQKHMAHHLLPSMGREWMQPLQHAFLIREPRAMLRSLVQVLPDARLADTGWPQQVELFEQCCQTGPPPPVLDSATLLQNPESILRQLCERLGLPFDPAMLTWPPGRRATDGAWAPAWYANVERSTGFHPYRPSSTEVPPAFEGLAQECEALYERLRPHALSLEPKP